MQAARNRLDTMGAKSFILIGMAFPSYMAQSHDSYYIRAWIYQMLRGGEDK
jgi:hypothetical protein